MSPEPRCRVVVGITGASGAAFGLSVLELCRRHGGVETHLVVSRGARSTVQTELERPVAALAELADVVHRDNDLGASISSGSFRTAGMIVAPCSIKTLSGIANSYDDNLIVRAADVTLKERRPLVLMVRETPLHAGHLDLMSRASAAGAIIFPPVPAMYRRPATVHELVEFSSRRALELLDVVLDDTPRWEGMATRSE